MRVSTGIEKVSDRIESLLKFYPELRDDDTLLFLAYLNRYHGLKELIGTENYRLLRSALTDEATPKFESIRRCRQKIQEGGQYLGTRRKAKLEEQERVKEVLNG